MAEVRQNANWSEADHPRDNDGKFAEKESAQSRFEREQEKQEQQTRKWTADTVSRHKIPRAQGFNRSNTKSHLAHAKDMGLNEKQYVKAAEQFFNGDKGKMYFGGKKYYKYDNATRLLCICNRDGTIHTFFRAKSKNLFSKLIKQYDLEEL